MKRKLLKISAYIVLVGSMVLALATLGSIFLIFVWIPEANLVKLLLWVAGTIILAFCLLILGTGAYEMINSQIETEEDVEEIKEEIEQIEGRK